MVEVSQPPTQETQRRTGDRGPGTPGQAPWWSWAEVRRGTPLRLSIDLVQYGVAVVLILLAVVVLIRSFIDFIGNVNDYPQTLVSAVDGVLVVIILVDILRTVLTHLEGWGFPFRPFLVIGIIAAVRDILAVSTRLTLAPAGNPSSGQVPLPQSLFELGTSAGVVLVLAVALLVTRGQAVSEENGDRSLWAEGPQPASERKGAVDF
ncbi:MAG TPA: phosphate-starvation-inducible PsiE family protein [Candidatus Dormibacteraeota bacterium]|nr:phosphate-starvation-inducible PsiE family protein [Candidatus Dormibacteraeota bacterium]